MKLDSVREIKSHFLQPLSTFGVGVSTPERKFPGTIALGITNGLSQPRLAVRCYGVRQHSLHAAFVDAITKYARGEVDVRYLEMPRAIEPMAKRGDKLANQGRCRPLNIGWSLGHYQITAGTLGCFAQKPGDKKGMLILSNNHVLARSNAAKVGDKIYQPGRHDGGSDKDTVAKLTNFVRLKPKHNKVDGATASINSDVEYDVSSLNEFGKFAGASNGDLDVGMEVRKFGRTTGATVGKVSAIEMDNVRVNYGEAGVLSFDNQIEIVGTKENFSAGGDSGSLVMNNKNQGVGLLFAGGGNRTYANDLQDVLKELKITLVK